jgi:murein tripeptide amidase MpaA
MRIDADIDGGSIRVLDASDPRSVELALRPDSAADFMQWFHFRVLDAEGQRCSLRIANAGEATYPSAWEGYRACASYDGERWFRVPTTFDGDALVIRHTPRRRLITYAYFAPYSSARRRRALGWAARSARARVERLGASGDGRPMNLVVLGDDDLAALKVWIVARQHPGESMAEWFMEGVLLRLLDTEDPFMVSLLDRAAVHLVPCMNPDGAALGNHRTNALGHDLNREWLSPTPERSPEVDLVRAALSERGVDLFLDIHGDESTPHVFAAGCEGNPGYTPRIDRLEDLFMDSLVAFDDSFQRRVGYALDAPGEADLSAAANFACERFDCLSLTLEMPFKDDADHPNPVQGWSPERARRFGQATLQGIYACLDTLR